MGVALSMPVFSPVILAMIVEVIIALILLRKRFFPVFVLSRCCSIAGTKGNIGSVCGCAQVGQAAALRNRAAGKQTIEILVPTLGGELPVEGASRCPGESWKAVFEIQLAQVINNVPVLVGQADAFVHCQLLGFVSAPVLVYQFRQANAGMLTGCFSILGVLCELAHGGFLIEYSKWSHTGRWQIGAR